MRKRVLSSLAVVLVLAVMATACGKENENEGGGGTTTIAGQKANDHGTKDVSGETSAELEQDNFYFEPTILKGTPGQKLTIELSNEGSALHNFSIPDQSIDQDVQPDTKGEVAVTFPDSGTLVFFCKYHQSQGMVGALEVS
jgi:plastocyanin